VRSARELEDDVSRLTWQAALVLAERVSTAVRTDQLRVLTEGLLDELTAQRAFSAQVSQERVREVANLPTFVDRFATGAEDLQRLTRAVQVTYNGVLQVFASLGNEDFGTGPSRHEHSGLALHFVGVHQGRAGDSTGRRGQAYRDCHPIR
jgi:hypothetical protein